MVTLERSKALAFLSLPIPPGSLSRSLCNPLDGRRRDCHFRDAYQSRRCFVRVVLDSQVKRDDDADAGDENGLRIVTCTSASETARLTDAIVDSFSTNAFLKYLFGDDANLERVLHGLFTASIGNALRRPEAAIVQTDEERRCCAVWFRDGGWNEPLLPLLRQSFELLLAMGPRKFARFIFIGVGMTSAHPKEPHMYLQLMATSSEHQGQGIGSALMHEMTQQLDKEGMCAYLESIGASSTRFYERHGFEVMDEPVRGLPKDATFEITPMWRAPK